MWWLLHPASAQGITMRGGWYVFLAAAIAVGLVVYGCIGWCLLRYRRRPGDTPNNFQDNLPLEILYVVLPLVIVIGLFLVSYAVEMPVDTAIAHPADRVNVTAFRWSWKFQYAGTGITVAGTPAQPATLYLPINRVTEIDLRSIDVTHSFWVPAFLFKRDAIPGMTNVFDLTPTRVGTYAGRCAQFCGIDHTLMTFTVRVVPGAAYDRFLATNGAAQP
jgi:cytochrome c oxidase subunit II